MSDKIQVTTIGTNSLDNISIPTIENTQKSDKIKHMQGPNLNTVVNSPFKYTSIYKDYPELIQS